MVQRQAHAQSHLRRIHQRPHPQNQPRRIHGHSALPRFLHSRRAGIQLQRRTILTTLLGAPSRGTVREGSPGNLAHSQPPSTCGISPNQERKSPANATNVSSSASILSPALFKDNASYTAVNEPQHGIKFVG